MLNKIVYWTRWSGSSASPGISETASERADTWRFGGSGMQKTATILVCFCGMAAQKATAQSPRPAATAVPSIIEYSIPTPFSEPYGITAGPDGNLWFTEYATSKIGKMTPAGVITEYTLAPTAYPAGITLGPDGNLWFAESQDDKIGKITPSGVITEYPIPTPGVTPYGITAGPDGNIWFTEWGALNIGKITTSGTITEYPCNLPNYSCNFAKSITSGPDGNLWFAPNLSEQLGVVTTDGAFSVAGFLSSPVAVTTGPDGNIWATGSAEVYKITPGLYNNAGQYVSASVGYGFTGIARGSDNNVWFLEQYSDSGSQVVRITTSGVETEIPIPSPNSLPTGITAGPDGNVWFTENYANKIGSVVLSAVVTPAVTLSPASLTFAGVAGGSSPPSQTFTVSSASPTAFSTSTTITFPPGDSGAWLVISPSGNLTTNQVITVTVNPATLSMAGAYSALISITAGTVTQTVSVTFNVAAPTTVNVTANPSTVSFGYTTGGAVPSPIAINFRSAAGTYTIPFTVAKSVTSPSGGNWLAVTDTSGDPVPNGTSFTTPQNLKVVATPTGLAAGVYSGTVTITPSGGSVVTIPVTLTVTSAPVLVASPTALSFTYQPGTGTSLFPQSLEVSEQSGLAVSFTATAVAATGGWLSVSPASGPTPQSLSVSVSAASLAAGNYSGSVVLTPAGGAPLTVPVSLTVMHAPLISSPSSLTFTFPCFGPAPASQTIQITAPDNTPAAFNLSTYLGQISLTPTSGTTPATIVVSVPPAALDLSPGTGGGQIVIAPTSQAYPQTIVPVIYMVTAGPTISAPSSLNFSYQEGGSVPAPASFQVTASRNVAVPIAAVMNGVNSWLSVSPIDSNTPSTVVATITPVGLSPGIYTSQILIYERVSGTELPPAATIPVTLTVTAGSFISASPSTLSFAWQRGTAAPPPQNIQVTSSTAAVPFNATAASTGNWLSVAPSSGATPATLAVSVSPEPLKAGVYSGTIAVNSTTTVAVTLTVTGIPLPAIGGIVNAASYAPGAVSPGEIVTIGGTGLGPADGLGLALDSNGNVATSLGEVSVSFNGYLAPLIYVGASQINCVVPYEVSSQTNVSLQVIFAGQTSSAYPLSVTPAAPGIFTALASGAGQAAVLNASGGVNGPANPAAAGGTIVIYMTGEGQTLPAGVTGKVTTVNTSSSGPLTPQPLVPPTVTIGELPATVTFYGEAPGLVSGALQINAVVPNGLSPGSQPLVVSFGSADSQSGVTIAVQ